MFKGRGNGGGGANHHSDTTLIASGASIEGTIRFNGTLEIEGEVIGDVIAGDDERAMIRILESGRVSGDVRAPMIVVNGGVNGNIYSTDHIELAARAAVVGDVHYNLIEMVKGAHVNGNLVFTQDPGPLSGAEAPPIDGPSE